MPPCRPLRSFHLPFWEPLIYLAWASQLANDLFSSLNVSVFINEFAHVCTWVDVKCPQTEMEWQKWNSLFVLKWCYLPWIFQLILSSAHVIANVALSVWTNASSSKSFPSEKFASRVCIFSYFSDCQRYRSICVSWCWRIWDCFGQLAAVFQRIITL